MAKNRNSLSYLFCSPTVQEELVLNKFHWIFSERVEGNTFLVLKKTLYGVSP
jgi:hypothetical protein